ncbi:MAG TPA: polysaccharide pyruvyl transferase family protein [Albitalea sp.]|uniref:polysaccharide pyruvyl transferase family protein n=1 Tax=Piscinibacter sp. TaxID=1903157 RepID=UPI002ED4ABF3
MTSVDAVRSDAPGAAPMAARTKRIGLLGMYASANLGDTAIQQAVMQALRARRPDIEFVGLCTDPEDAARTFGIRARHLSGAGGLFDGGAGGAPSWTADAGIDPQSFPAPLHLVASARRIARHMAGLDMLLVSGSGQIDDFWGGPWEQPFRLLAWSGAARRQGKPVGVFGVGVDQLLTRLGRSFCRRALERAQLRVVRDGGSLDALRSLGLTGPVEVAPDPAFHLTDRGAAGNASAGPAFAVVSPIARQAWPGAEPEEYEAYLAALAAAADALQRRSLEVRFVCSQTRMDPPVVERVRQRMRTDAGATREVPVATVDEYMREVRDARVVVGSRLHAMILALVAGAPVVAVSYARKVRRQLEDIGLGRQVLDLRGLRRDELLARIEEVLDDEQPLREHIRSRTVAFRAQLDEHFDRLAALIPR